MNEHIVDEYFNWLYDLMCDDSYKNAPTYHDLFEKLFNTEFTWTIDRDANRAFDGREMRYIFADEYRYSDERIDEAFDDRPASVLEVMIAMVLRCEHAIAEDERYGDRSGQWFWTMLVNIGLGDMADGAYDETRADEMLSIFLNRKYGNNELGCPFFVKHPKAPMKDTELWMQFNWYLAEVL